jgi:hypothetical protein
MDQVRPKHRAAQEKKNAFEIAAQESRARVVAYKERKEDSEKYRRKIESTKKKVDDFEKQLSVGDERETRRRLVQTLMKHLDGVVKTVEVHAEQQHQMAQLEAKSAGALISKRALVPLEEKLRYGYIVTSLLLLQFVPSSYRHATLFCLSHPFVFVQSRY